jgi:ribonucleotide reductase alpha subunit
MLLLLSEGSVQGLEELPESLRAVYRMAREVLMRSLIDMAAERGAFIDQRQSLNLFIENPNIGQTSSASRARHAARSWAGSTSRRAGCRAASSAGR